MTMDMITKRNYAIGALVLAVAVMVLIALFIRTPDGMDKAENVLHEIRTFDAWKQSAQVNPYGQRGMGGFCQTYPAGGLYQAAAPGMTPIFANQEPPVLIKEMGFEAIPASGGKVKITGVMGNSWAERGGLRAGDIIVRFDGKSITSFANLQELLKMAAPEKDYKVHVLRSGRLKKCLVTVGEGELEGFTPIVR